MKVMRPVKALHVLTGAAVVLAGAMAAIWMAPGLTGVIALLALIRICWLEDNIISDLFGQEKLPPGYRNTAQMRRHMLLRLFGIWQEEGAAEGSAHLMATAMRAEVQIWGAVLLGMASALVALSGPFGLPVNLGVAAVLFAMALIRADRLALSLAHCEAGEVLPDRLLLPRRRRILADRRR